MGKQVVIARFVDWSEAQVARGLLESNGISCLVSDSNIAAIEWGINLGQGGIRLTLLDDTDAPAALELLEAVRRGELDRALQRFDSVPGDDADS